MEVILKQGDVLSIPEGCKATIKDNTVIIENGFENGDVLHSYTTDTIVIFKRNEDIGIFSSYYNTNTLSNDDWRIKAFRLATEEEKQQLFDKMKENGLRWNAEAKKVETIRWSAKKIRWRAETWDTYWCLNSKFHVIESTEHKTGIDDERWNGFNYFQTKKQAKQAAKRIAQIVKQVKDTLKKLHEENN